MNFTRMEYVFIQIIWDLAAQGLVDIQIFGGNYFLILHGRTINNM